MARKILFTSQKGGVGKSTLARSLAVTLACEKGRVLIADFDGAQGTCLRWRAQRAARSLLPEVSAVPLEKAAKLKRAAKGYDDVVIDTAGRLDDLCIELAREADAVFLPSSFSLDDILPTLKMIETLRLEGTAQEKIAVVFCRTGGSKAQEAQARSVLAMNNIAALNSVFPQKDGFVSLYATGRAGRESQNAHLRAAAEAVDAEMLTFLKLLSEKSEAA